MSQRELASLPIIWRVFKIIGDVIWDMRAPLIVSIIAFAVFAFPPQIKETFKVLALDWGTDSYRTVLSLLFLIAFSYFLWSMSRAMWINSIDLHPNVTHSGLARVISHLFSLFIALLPVAGVLVAIFPDDLFTSEQAGWDPAISLTKALLGLSEGNQSYPLIIGLGYHSLIETEAVLQDIIDFPLWVDRMLDSYKFILSDLVWFFRSVLAVLGLMLVFLLWRAMRRGSQFSQRPFSAKFLTIFAAALTIIVAAIAAQPVVDTVAGKTFFVTWLLSGAGSIVVICTFFIFLTYFFAAGTRVYDVVGIPVITILVGAALIFSFTGLNENHRVRLNASSVERPDSFTDAFLEWYRSRPDERVRKYVEAGEPYPVYIVTARGGGVYAANLTAITLARLYTACPALRHHVFAVIAVSGGSLGASTFGAHWLNAKRNGSAEVAGDDCPTDPPASGVTTELERQINTYLGHDFLSPVLSSALFPDFVQRFIAPGFGVLDRARAFEASLNHAWLDTMRRHDGEADSNFNPFGMNFLKFSQELRENDGPALILNTTNVESGGRFAVAPFANSASPIREQELPVKFMHPLSVEGPDGFQDVDIALATAVSLSSRFPYILPPGQYLDRVSGFYFQERQLADGGYFESSAIDTGLDLVQAIQDRLQAEQRPEVRALLADPAPSLRVEPEFRFVVLNESYISEEAKRQYEEGVSEFEAPVTALNRTRYRRGELAAWRLRRELTEGRLLKEAYFIELQHGEFDIPLGWHLSETTQDAIALQIGFPIECRKDPFQYKEQEGRTGLSLASAEGRVILQKLATEFNDNRCQMKRIIAELEPS